MPDSGVIHVEYRNPVTNQVEGTSPWPNASALAIYARDRVGVKTPSKAARADFYHRTWVSGGRRNLCRYLADLQRLETSLSRIVLVSAPAPAISDGTQTTPTTAREEDDTPVTEEDAAWQAYADICPNLNIRK